MKLIKVIVLLFVATSYVFASYSVRIRDITYINGIKRNIITGYGLVVGLDGTGDSRNVLTKKTINQYLSHNGIEIAQASLVTKNSAVVAVSVSIDGFIEKGDLADIDVASIGDAKSIDNGMLLQTVLRAANGDIYVVASGIVSSGTSDKANKRRGLISSGGIIERSAGSQESYLSENKFILVLKNPEISRASLIKEAIESADPQIYAEIKNYKQIIIKRKDSQPLKYKAISDLLDIKVNISSKARVVIDRQTGIVVAGDNVRIDSAFISVPGISVQVKNKSDLNNVIAKNNTVSELATAFNNIGVAPKDIIAIFTALKKCGALNAEIIIQ